MNSSGFASDGTQYRDAREMWSTETSSDFAKASWYDKGIRYWNGIEATVDGVLGGFGGISSADVKHSRQFLAKIAGARIEEARASGRPVVACDCGGEFKRPSLDPTAWKRIRSDKRHPS